MVGIALASVGLLSPPLAALIHVTSELAFILNSARLLPRRETILTMSKTSEESTRKALLKAA